MQGIYQLDVQGPVLFENLKEIFRDDEADLGIIDLAYQWCQGTWNNLQECNEIISSSTIKWNLSRLSAVDKSILRLSVYQLLYCSDIPPKVIINEAIELAKKFSTAQSPSFINGVLDAALKKIKAANVKTTGSHQ